MLIINGVNKKQKKLLKYICDFDTITELEYWVASLSKKKQQQANLLVELVELAVIDEHLYNNPDYTDADIIMEKIMYGNNSG